MTVANWDAVKKQYDAGLADAELSYIFNIKLSTLRSYRNRHKWGNSNRSNATRNVANNSIDRDVEQRIKFEDAMIIELGLNAKQARFCRNYARSYNAAQAYLNAYHCTLATARTNSSKLLKNTNINQFIGFLNRNSAAKMLIDRNTVLNRLWTLANANPLDVVEWTNYKQQAKDQQGKPIVDAEGQPVSYYHTELHLRDDADLSNVKQLRTGKHSLNVVMESKIKAFDTLLKYLPDERKEAAEHSRFNFEVANELYSIRSLLVDAGHDKSKIDRAIKKIDALKRTFE